MIPEYTIGALLGPGGSGAVYEAVQRSTGRSVAIKVLDASVTDEAALARFTRARNLMATLATHPHVVARSAVDVAKLDGTTNGGEGHKGNNGGGSNGDNGGLVPGF